MHNGQLNWIANFIWGIADYVLRDVYVRGKYRDVILPMLVIRRLDAVLEPTKDAVLRMKANLDKAKVANQEAALRNAAGQAFYNASPFTLQGSEEPGKGTTPRRTSRHISTVFPRTSRRSWQVQVSQSDPHAVDENDLIGVSLKSSSTVPSILARPR